MLAIENQFNGVENGGAFEVDRAKSYTSYKDFAEGRNYTFIELQENSSSALEPSADQHVLERMDTM